MALTLNTSHPLYSNIVAFVCVDDDNTVKELKGDACTTDAAVVIGTGTYGRHFRTTIVSNNAKGVALTNGHVTKPVSNPVGTTIVVFNSASSRASRGAVTDTTTATNGGNTVGVYNGDAAGCQSSSNYPVALGTTDVIGTGAHLIAAAWTDTTEYKTWVDGNQENLVSGSLGNANDGYLTKYIGGAPTGGFGGLAADYVYYIHFRKYLSEAELDEIYTSLGANNQVSLLNSGGTAPTGAVTIGTITPNSTGASVPFTYSAADQTGFEYQLNETGTIYPIAASPATPTGLTSSTAYTIRVMAVNASGSGAWSTSAPFTTSAGGDTTPPTFTSAPAVSSITQTGGTATATIDEAGSIFYVIVPQAESTPSVSQVIAGQSASGTAPIDSGSAVGTTTLSDAFTGLTAGAAYKACFVARDDEATPNVQATVTVVNFNAAAAPVGTITITGVANNTNTPWISAAVDSATVMPISLGSVVVNKTGLSTTAGADLVVTDASIATGTEYIIILKIGTAYGWYRAVAT